MSTFPITIKPFGPHAIQIQWPDRVGEDILNDMLTFEAHLKSTFFKDDASWEMVPAYNSLLLVHRYGDLRFEDWEPKLKQGYKDKKIAAMPKRHLWKLPVCYDPEFGIDQQEVGKRLGLSVKELVQLHTRQAYTVYGIGFLPGFMYLGGLPQGLELPRRKTPRLKVEKGSVGLAGKQTGIYPQVSPGGWHIIGHCPVPMFNAEKDSPCFVSVGDKVRFYAISRSEYELHKIEMEVGIYKLDKTLVDD